MLPTSHSTSHAGVPASTFNTEELQNVSLQSRITILQAIPNIPPFGRGILLALANTIQTTGTTERSAILKAVRMIPEEERTDVIEKARGLL